MNLYDKLTATGVVAIFILMCTLTYGWFANIFDIVATVGGDFTTLLALRLLGIFVAPLGSILGLLS